jgi:hypothetical protein
VQVHREAVCEAKIQVGPPGWPVLTCGCSRGRRWVSWQPECTCCLMASESGSLQPVWWCLLSPSSASWL